MKGGGLEFHCIENFHNQFVTKLVWSIPWQRHLSLIKEIRPRPDFRSQTIFPNFSIIIFEFVAYSALLCNDHITTALFDIFGPAKHIHCIYSIYSERTSFRQKFLTILYYVMFRRLVKKSSVLKILAWLQNVKNSLKSWNLQINPIPFWHGWNIQWAKEEEAWF